jgi:cytochrome b6-f complex iron-sulfur subunit
MNRREFLTWVGIGGIASSLPVAIAACSPQNPPPASQTKQPASPIITPRSDGFQSVGTVADLDSKGQILNPGFSAGSLLVLRNPADSKTLAAVNPTCTHKGCAVVWKTEEKLLLCPCHGSKFALNGKVISGVATKPLPTYEAKIEGNSVLVKVS